ncbi:MAG: class II glutamine amidotransferase [Acidimicrobiales bacterium]
MCELLTVAYESPQRLGPLLDRALDVERYGVDGFGWGVAWLDVDDGRGIRVQGYRKVISLAEDGDGRRRLSDVASVRFLIHLRRPSLLSTVQLADTQPFVDRDGRFAFAHNGRFDHHDRYRERFGSALEGRADSEVGFALFRAELEHETPRRALAATLAKLGGYGNLVYLGDHGEIVAIGAHYQNPFWRFRLDGAAVACTAFHSEDRSLFELVFTDARDEVPVGRTAEIVAPPL